MLKKLKRIAGKKKLVILFMCVLLITVSAVLVFSRCVGGNEKVSFEPVKEEFIPQDISSNVIPEYKTLERALACSVDDDIYVMVTRGEKPSSGFGVSIDSMILEEVEDKTNLIVYAAFKDPDKENPISQIITYPLCIVKTDLKALPDTIELRIQY